MAGLWNSIRGIVELSVTIGGTVAEEGTKKAAWSIGERYGWAKAENYPHRFKIQRHQVKNRFKGKAAGGHEFDNIQDEYRHAITGAYANSSRSGHKHRNMDVPKAENKRREDDEDPAELESRLSRIMAGYRWGGSSRVRK